MVDVSIIIVSYNTRDLVLQCIASVIECMEQVVAGGRLSVDARAISRGYEIIVVDNASTDSSAATILRRFPEVRLIANDFNRGFAAANNQAIAVSQGRFLFFLNPDTLVRQNAITELMRFLNRYPRVGVATGKLINPDGSLQHSAFHFPSLWMELLDHFPFSQRLVNSALNGRYSRLDYRRPFEIDHPLGACMMVRREVVGRVGAFSEDFFLYCEEIDWCMRIKQRRLAHLLLATGGGGALRRAEHAPRTGAQFPGAVAQPSNPLPQALQPLLPGAGKAHHGPGPVGRACALGAALPPGRDFSEQLPCAQAGTQGCAGSSAQSGLNEMSATLTAIVIAQNEAHHIQACLQSLSWADQRLVVDGGSVDGTAELALEEGARVLARPFDTFARQRNHAIDQCATEWVLFVDADERVEPALAQEIVQTLEQPAHQGYWVPRRNLMLGRWVRHAGWWPDYQLRLVRRGGGRYDETRDPHELMDIQGSAGHLETPLLHHNYSSISSLFSRQRVYAQREARSLLAQGVAVQQRSLFSQPVREFFRRYLALQGYRDGPLGLLLAIVMAWYRYQVCAAQLAGQVGVPRQRG